MSAFGLQLPEISISRDRTATEIQLFFMMKARRSESKASINYLRGTFQHTLS